jgi:hypothetical protein
MQMSDSHEMCVAAQCPVFGVLPKILLSFTRFQLVDVSHELVILHAVSPKLQLFASDVQIGAKTTITDRDGPQIAKVFLQTCLSAVCLSNLLKASIFPM